jgi:hypothetical protein
MIDQKVFVIKTFYSSGGLGGSRVAVEKEYHQEESKKHSSKS